MLTALVAVCSGRRIGTATARAVIERMLKRADFTLLASSTCGIITAGRSGEPLCISLFGS